MVLPQCGKHASKAIAPRRAPNCEAKTHPEPKEIKKNPKRQTEKPTCSRCSAWRKWLGGSRPGAGAWHASISSSVSPVSASGLLLAALDRTSSVYAV